MLRQLEVKITSFSKEGILTNGPMTFADFLVRGHQGDLLKARSAATYDRNDWRKTDPNNPNTDRDNIPDTHDINPNGLSPKIVELVFKQLAVFETVDLDYWNGGCTPEAYLIIDIKTAGSDLRLDTPNFDLLPRSLACNDELDLAGVLTQTVLNLENPSPGPLERRFSTGDALLAVNLVEESRATRLGPTMTATR